MGNFSSCTTGTLPQSSPSPNSLHASAPPQSLATVLLIDGSMLKFKTPIRVTKLLLAYPNHLVCLLDSLKPGLHSLSTLLPDDKLLLGRLYLLLPFKSNAAMEKSLRAVKSKKKRMPFKVPLEMQERGEQPPRDQPTGDKFQVGFAACANDDKKRDVGLNRITEMQSSSELQREEVLHMISKKNEEYVGRSWHWKYRSKELKSDGFEGCAEITQKKYGDVGLLHDRRHLAASISCSYEKLNSERRGRRVIHTACSMNDRKPILMRERHLADSGRAREIRHGLSSLCDTPELQRAYRSLLRRSSSWTPRLQPIVERR